MFYQIFLLPQVKRSLVISNRLAYAISQTSCRTTKDLRFQEIGKVQNNFKMSWNYNLLPTLPPKNKTLLILVKGSWKIEIEVFTQCAILHENQSFSQVFCLWLQNNKSLIFFELLFYLSTVTQKSETETKFQKQRRLFAVIKNKDVFYNFELYIIL